MSIITSIDLWITNNTDNFEEFDAAFADGIGNNPKDIAYDHYLIVKNCHALSACNDPRITVRDKQLAIVFYRHNKPVRLLLSDQHTQVEACISHAVVQRIGNYSLQSLHEKYRITHETISLDSKPLPNDSNNSTPEALIYSCDRYSLFKDFLNGNSPASLQNIDLTYLHDLELTYHLQIDDDSYYISHHGGLVSHDFSRVIPFQKDSAFSI